MKRIIRQIKWKIDFFLIYFLYNQNNYDEYFQYLTRKWHLKTTSLNLMKFNWNGKLVTPDIWYNLPDCKNNLDRLITLLKDNPDYQVRNSNETNHLCNKKDNIIFFRSKDENPLCENSEEMGKEIVIYSGCTYCTNPCFKIDKIESCG